MFSQGVGGSAEGCSARLGGLTRRGNPERGLHQGFQGFQRAQFAQSVLHCQGPIVQPVDAIHPASNIRWPVEAMDQAKRAFLMG